jgi:hypothetical protein
MLKGHHTGGLYMNCIIFLYMTVQIITGRKGGTKRMRTEVILLLEMECHQSFDVFFSKHFPQHLSDIRA